MFRAMVPTRRNTLIALAFLLVLLAPTLPAVAAHKAHKEVREQIDELEQQWRVATLAADVPAMDRLLSDDYVGISWNGQLNTKAMQLDRTRSRIFALTRLDLTDTKVKVVGNVAIVTARAVLAGTSEGKDLEGSFRYTRVYQRTPAGSWKITNFEATRVPDAGEHPRHNHT